MADYLIYIACVSSVAWFAYQMGFNSGMNEGMQRGIALQIVSSITKREYIKEKNETKD